MDTKEQLIDFLNKRIEQLEFELKACDHWNLVAHQNSFIEGLEWTLQFIGRDDLGMTDEDIVALVHGKINELESENHDR